MELTTFTIDGVLYKSIYYDDQNPQGNYTLYDGQNIINNRD